MLESVGSVGNDVDHPRSSGIGKNISQGSSRGLVFQLIMIDGILLYTNKMIALLPVRNATT